MHSLLRGSLFILSCTQVWGQYFETLTGFNTLGDHFGATGYAGGLYDYVVVGGGTAGLTIATRLAQSGSSVAVVEAGGFYEFDNGNLSTVPATAAYYIGTNPSLSNPLIDWGYRTGSEPGLGGRSILYNSGKTLGGGSARNYGIYNRGTRGAYQKWADLVGDSSYTFDNFLPFFKKSVHFDPPNNAVRAANASVNPDPTHFGLTGLVHVTFNNWANTWGSYVKLGLRQLGLKELPDFVSGTLAGFQYSSLTLDGPSQTRSSSETSYLRYAMQNTTNLQVFKSALAKKILFDGNKKATGVLIDIGGFEFPLNAGKEVILSAGTHRSPQLLMVSGIGPAATLSGLGINVLSNLAGVGQNLWDQPYFGPSYPVSIVTHSSLGANPAFAAQQFAAYRTSRTGQLTNSGSDFLAWEKIPQSLLATLSPSTRRDLKSSFPPDWPTFQHTFADAYYGTGDDLLVGAPTDGRQYVSILPTLVATFSRGNVTINSTDTAVNPVIFSGLLNDPRDQELAIAAFKRARQIANTTQIRRIRTGDEVYPGANITSDAEILAAVKRQVSPIWHASGTCKMGQSSDNMAVVDSQARVFGVSGLRVVDASAFPFLPPNHPQGTVYALAEKIASVITSGSSSAPPGYY